MVISLKKYGYGFTGCAAAGHQVLLSIREFDDSAMFIHHDTLVLV